MKCHRLKRDDKIPRGTIAYFPSGAVNLCFGERKGVQMHKGKLRFTDRFVICVSPYDGCYFVKVTQ